MIEMFFISFPLFLCVLYSALFSSELNCPYGCCTQEYDPEVGDAAKEFVQCLKSVGFREEDTMICGGIPLEGKAGASPGFDSTPLYYERHAFRNKEGFGKVYYYPLATIDWIWPEEFDISGLDFASSFEIEYEFENYALNQRVNKSFYFESYSDALDAFSQLRGDIIFWAQSEIELLNIRSDYARKDLESLNNGNSPLPSYLRVDKEDLRKNLNKDILRYQEDIRYRESKKNKALNTINRAESNVNAIYKHIFQWCYEKHKVIGAL